jgi:hypothetical protein
VGIERNAERSAREPGQCDEARDPSDGAPGGRRSLTTAALPPVPASTDLEPCRHGSVRCVVGRKRGLSRISFLGCGITVAVPSFSATSARACIGWDELRICAARRFSLQAGPKCAARASASASERVPSSYAHLGSRSSAALFRAIALALLLGGTHAAPAFACQSSQFERTLLYEQRDIDAGIDAPAIVDITIETISTGPDNTLVAHTRVHRVIKGVPDGEQIILTVVPWSCDRGLIVGARGIVAGTIAPSPKGGWEITPIFERFSDRNRRRRNTESSRSR